MEAFIFDALWDEIEECFKATSRISLYVYKICLILKWQSNISKRFLPFIIVHINGFYLNVVSKIESNFKIRVTELNTKIEIRIDYKCFLFNGPLFAKMLLLLRFNYLSGTSEFDSASEAKFDSSNWWVINEPKQIDSYQITFSFIHQCTTYLYFL